MLSWGVNHVSCLYLWLLSFQSSSSSFTCLSESRRDSLRGREASWLCPPTSCFRGSRKDSRFLQIRRVFFGSRTFWLEPHGATRASWQLPTASTEATCVTPSTWRPGRTASSPCQRPSPPIDRYCLARWSLWDCFKWLLA